MIVIPLNLLYRENMILPGGHIQIQPASLQIPPVPIVAGVTEQIPESPPETANIRKRYPDKALTLMLGIVHGHEQPIAAVILPGKNNKGIDRAIAFPGGNAVEQLPASVSDDRMSQHPKQPVIELHQMIVDGRRQRLDDVHRP